MQEILDKFFKHYPTPNTWLTCKEKKRIRGSNNSDETWYILCWMLEEDLWTNLIYQDVFFNYFLKRHLSRSYSHIATHLGFISPNEVHKIKSIDSRISVFKIYLLCLCLKTSLKDLTYQDIATFPDLKSSKNYTPRRLQNILIQLGYSNIRGCTRKKSQSWGLLLHHKQFGEIFSYHYQYLKSANAKSSYLTSCGTSLKKLLDFMEDKSLNDFSVFTPVLFEELINYIAEKSSPQTAGAYIPHIKTFFKVNLGEPYFPKEFIFCDLYWSSYTRMIKKIIRQTDGRAFSSLELAENIVTILKNYEPVNDTELVCKNFWLIIASCPARFSYILNLRAEDAIKPLPNNPNAYGIYSKFADKAGNTYGQFPILDKIGVEAVTSLQKRAKHLNLEPLFNPKYKESYVHLFQLPNSPWILDSNILNKFYSSVVLDKIKADYPENTDLRATAHSFRHFLITHVALKTGDEEVCQTAAGHKDLKMTREYLRSSTSRNQLLFRVIDKYENKEITGKFYLRLIELLSSSETPLDQMLYALTTEMELDEFLNTYGRKLQAGYCFNNKECYRWHACWNCNHFVLTKNEIIQAIHTLSYQLFELKNFQKCKDFSYELPMIKNKFKLISLIIKRLTELGLTEQEISDMTTHYLINQDVTKGGSNHAATTITCP